MKRSVLSILLVTILVFALGAQNQTQQSAEEVQKNLALVDKPQAVPDALKAGFETITAESAMALLNFVSSDLLEGRDTTSRGYKIAAEYAASLFEMWGIKPAGDMPTPAGRFRMGATPSRTPPKRTYLQEVVFRETSEAKGTITLDITKGQMTKSKTYNSGVDFTSMSSASETISAPVVFAGYGITEKAANWNDFKNLDVKGKIVLILSEAPGKDNPESPFNKNKDLKKKYFPAAQQFRMRRGRGNAKMQALAKLGPAAVIQVQNTGTDAQVYKQLAATRRPSDERPIIKRVRRRLSLPGIPGFMSSGNPLTITVSREIANAILENSGKTIDELKETIEKNMKPASTALSGTRLTIAGTAKTQLVKCYNVLGFLEGSDPELKKEVIVIGAHYDHLGRWEDYIYNGADDNGSGSVGVLLSARAFATNPVKPKRSIVFALWTGEEKGLLGSRYYTRNPFKPIEKTSMYFNMDMISRAYDEQTFTRMSRMFQFEGGKEMMAKINLEDFLTVSFTEGLDDMVREANQHIGLHLYLRKAEEGRGGGGSDHASFAGVKVPYVYTMAAMTGDYHQTSDSVEKVHKKLFTKACQLTYLVSFAAANK